MAEDFKVSVIEMKDGRLLTGVVVQAAERMLSVQTQEELIQLDRSEVDSARQQQLSLMPDGLLEPLTEDQVRDLFGYLSGVGQVALPAGE
jgi:putative heme-binding domain-containing protein